MQRKTQKDFKEVEKYEYLLVEYLKEMSNELTYLLLIVCALFLFVIIDLIPTITADPQYQLIKLAFIVIIIGGFGLFGMSGLTKRRIEAKFEKILR